MSEAPNSWSTRELHLEDFERCLDGILRRGCHNHMPGEFPAFERYHRTPDLPGEPYLRERPVLSAEGDDHVARADDRQVSGMPRACSYGME